MTRGTIRSRVEYYLDRSDLRALIYGWIEDTRLDLALKHDFRYLYAESSVSTTASTKTYALPVDYLGHATVWCAYKKLARLTAREFDELTDTDHEATAYPRALTIEDGSSVFQTENSGPPDYYVERGVNIELYPTPDATHTLTYKYYASPTSWTSIDTTDDANYDYITTFHGEAVIWGAALRGAIYLDDDQKAIKFEKHYQLAVQEMIKREKKFENEDQHFRMKTWKDFEATTFKRLFKIQVE